MQRLQVFVMLGPETSKTGKEAGSSRHALTPRGEGNASSDRLSRFEKRGRRSVGKKIESEKKDGR